MSMREQEDSDSSSNDSVCFGPYTIGEAKRDVQKCIPRKVDRRHSSIYRHFDISKEIDKITTQFEEATNLSSNPSEYLTTNEADPTEEASKPSDFLDKLSKVINEPVSGSTSYNTASDQTNVQEDGGSHLGGVLDMSVISISDDSSSPYEFIVEEELDISKSPIINHMDSNCKELISDAIRDEFEDEHLPVHCKETDTSGSYGIDDNYPSSDLKISNATDESEKRGEDEIVNDLQSVSPVIVNIDIRNSPHMTHETPQPNYDGVLPNYNYLSKITEKTEGTTYYDSCSSTDKEVLAVQMPLIHVDQFDDSSCEFNDTLEEMNKFLEEGSGYSNPVTTTPKLDVMNKSTHDFPSLENKSPIVKNIKSYSVPKKVCKPSIEIKASKTTSNSKLLHTESKIKPPSVIAKSLFTKPNTEPTFKLPSKPVKKLPTPSKVSSSALKNVVSPVGIYIKHSPRYCPMINVPNKTRPKTNSKRYQSAESSSFKENIPEMPKIRPETKIPAVIYKPAQTKVATEIQDVLLPGSIRKLISPQVVTKHERRIEAKVCDQSLERRLLESDLSIDVNQSGQEVANSDVSILTHKQPFNLM